MTPFRLCAAILAALLVQCASRQDTAHHEEESRAKKQGGLSVLIVTPDFPGHFHPLLSLQETLVSRGHSVSIMTFGMREKRLAKVCAERGIELHTYGEVSDDVAGELRRTSRSLNPFTALSVLAPLLFDGQDILINSFAADPEKLIHSNDVVVLDHFFPLVTRWLNTHTNLTVISFTQIAPIAAASLPRWHFPRFLPHSSPHPDFANRLAMVAYATVEDIVMNTIGYSYRYYTPMYTPAGVYNPEIVGMDFGFDYPRPLYPMMHYVGPVVSQKQEVLSEELKVWLDQHSPRSVLYVSMGSMQTVTEDLAAAIVTAARELDYDILWGMRHSNQAVLDKLGDSLTSGKVFVSGWMPQATVLRHPSISFAILHCGLGGVNEALVAGVPVIGYPAALATDQPANCIRVHHQGLGVCLYGAENITSDLLQHSIREIERGPHRKTIRKLNAIFKEAGGVERAADLIEFYHKVGYSHLVPFWAKHQWSTVQYYNFDVYATIAGVVVLVVFVLYKCSRCVGRRVCCRGHPAVEKAKKD